jgi:pimeloyl-ACP methyl ester carboxylesterase
VATFVFVHGARHSAWCWHLVQQQLSECGIASAALDLSLTSVDDDAAQLREFLDGAGEDLVVVGHSRGGRVMSVAAIGSTNVSRLVFLAAHVNEPEISMPGGPRPTPRAQVPLNQATLTDEEAREIFYHDVPDELAAEAIRRLRPSPPNTRVMNCDEPMAWHSIPSTYIVSSEDRCIHPDDQREMALQMEDVFEIPTSHSGFLSRPDLVTEILVRYA